MRSAGRKGISGAPPLRPANARDGRRAREVPADKGELRVALDQLAEQDPLSTSARTMAGRALGLALRRGPEEVIEATLASDYGIDVEFRETTPICVERPVATGEAVEFKRKHGNPFLATVGLRIEPGLPAARRGVRRAKCWGRCRLRSSRRSRTRCVRRCCEGLSGWQVTDCTVTMTHSGYFPRQSHAHQGFSKAMSSTGADFRGLTPLVLMSALKEAGRRCVSRCIAFTWKVPRTRSRPRVGARRGFSRRRSPAIRDSSFMLEGVIAAANVPALRPQVSGVTRGEGVLECEFECYEPVSGGRRQRARGRRNPIDREEYLLHVGGCRARWRH